MRPSLASTNCEIAQMETHVLQQRFSTLTRGAISGDFKGHMIHSSVGSGIEGFIRAPIASHNSSKALQVILKFWIYSSRPLPLIRGWGGAFLAPCYLHRLQIAITTASEGVSMEMNLPKFKTSSIATLLEMTKRKRRKKEASE